MIDQEYLFVYGTLRRGFNHPVVTLLERGANFVGMGYYQGQLYDVGPYPAVVASSRTGDTVVGDVYALHPDPTELLSRLDAYEEYFPNNHAQSLYLRQKEPIRDRSGIVHHAWVYLYARPTAHLRRIESGDYLEYLKLKALS
ncbi:MAG: gamma-glutamylcyclotransferase family protein [Anaerolineae bacterium]|nr:gamma-glutamylcyclotransferase family protein [Anaerolineae bacterium]